METWVGSSSRTGRRTAARARRYGPAREPPVMTLRATPEPAAVDQGRPDAAGLPCGPPGLPLLGRMKGRKDPLYGAEGWTAKQ